MKHVKKIGAFSLLVVFLVIFFMKLNGVFLQDGKQTMVVDTNNITDIVLSPGNDSTQLNFNWYSDNDTTTSIVQIALLSDMKKNIFPVDKAVTFTGTNSYVNDTFVSNKVTANGFKEDTEYVYRLGNGINWSPIYSYTTKSTSQYSVLLAGDAQIGASFDIESDTTGWVDTINKATKKFSNTSFLLSVGDQVNNGNEINKEINKELSNELEYAAYLQPSQFTSLPIAPVAGNHEEIRDGHIYHFNLPNMSTTYGTIKKGTTGGDYYFTYGNTLYMMLNSNNYNEEEHLTFMKSAISANPSITWKIVCLHDNVYSITSAMFDQLGIDVVLSGHYHCYTRTYQIKGGQVQENANIDYNGNVLNPTGTLYIIANSASGSKYYDINPSPPRC